MSQGKRYKFQGSEFAVQTALAGGKTITAITAANPPLVTATAHGYTTGDVVYLTGITGMTQLNNQEHVITVTTSNAFTLVGVDASAYTAFDADSPNTSVAEKVTFTDFCELKSFTQQDAAADLIDVTTICSTVKEYEIGLSDTGTLALEYNYAGNETVQAALRAAKISGAQIAFMLKLPTTGGTIIMFGFVQSQSIAGGVSEVIKGSAQIKLTGDIVVLAA